MSSNRRANNSRNRRERNGQLTRAELKKKYGSFGSFREDPEDNRQYQLDSGALKSKMQGDPKSTAKSKFLGSSGTVGDYKQNQNNQTKSKKLNPSYLSYPIKRNASEQTGDTFLIKCLEYVPPKTGMGLGVSFDELKYDKGKGFSGTVNGGERVNIAGKGDDFKGTAGFKAVNFKVNYSNAHDRMTNANGLPGLQQDKITKYYIELPIPQEVNDSNSVTWGEDSLNIFQLAGLAAAQNLIKEPGRSFQAVAEVLQKGIPLPELDENTKNSVLAGISGQAINALGGNVSPGSVIARSTGQILNSNLELLFQGVNLRSFPFSVTFSPRNYDETERVRLIIRYLKQTMAPKTGNEGGRMGTFLKSPDVFSLRYLHNGQDHPFLNSFKLCALTGLSVNYTNSGTYASYYDGAPVNIRLNMSFKELNPIYSEDYDSGDAGGGVGY